MRIICLEKQWLSNLLRPFFRNWSTLYIYMYPCILFSLNMIIIHIFCQCDIFLEITFFWGQLYIDEDSSFGSARVTSSWNTVWLVPRNSCYETRCRWYVSNHPWAYHQGNFYKYLSSSNIHKICSLLNPLHWLWFCTGCVLNFSFSHDSSLLFMTNTLGEEH